jgi:DNA-binding response OmpR family regulator
MTVRATGVLIVDDEPSIRKILRRSLVEAGYTAYEAAGPVEASRIFLEEQIDAVILDLRMPGLSGFNFLDWLRTEPSERMQTVPVFILTGSELSDAERETLHCQRAEVFYKPQGIAEILKALERESG